MLFIHGGPGGIGVVDFCQYQGGRLSKSFKIIAPEQRGVWRSEPILDNEHTSLEDIIEDFEELRKKLHINKWSLLSHSFGVYLAVLYANLYPDSIEYMIYECPSFDFALSERAMLKAAANELIKLGNSILAEEYFKALKDITDYKEINKLLMKALSDLKENCNNFMWFGNDKQIITFDFSGHYVRIEEPDKYCEVITNYVYKVLMI